MTTVMYGIANCDTVKKAKKWLQQAEVEFSFHDYRKQGIDAALVERFCHELGWEKVLNKRGTTYRGLTDEQKASLNQNTAVDLLVANPAMIKRPILETDGHLQLGFTPAQYATLF
ncbi:ArsC family reductase [Vibrio sp. SM6]|uniref:ArsC family reductase n=1 Tax=Vibrio agarilyticus TaxID=2726741 RepID=A0A7X8YH90_9VIBR|nr:ArsC family reductase [Vibrio agarilyticus]NLS13211.1 ArsC family reductase [Vibrio agarilyticus]